MKSYSYNDADTDIGPSRYIMNYGKMIDTGRIGKLPDAIDKWILYNAEEDIMARSRYDNTVHFSDKDYSTKKLWKITKNNKVRLVPVSTLISQLDQKSWSNTRSSKKSALLKEYSPKEVMENTNRSPDHYNRVLNVDLSYPIIVYRNIHEGWQVVLDGLHRLAKSFYINKDDMITVKYVTYNQLSKSELKEQPVKDVGRKLMVKKALKRPGYYLFGISQNSSYIDNVGALYAISMAMGKRVSQYISEVIDILNNSNIYLSLLNGQIIKYFKNKSELINSLLILFSETAKGFANSKFDKWNELFIDLTRLCYNIYVIILEDLDGHVNMILPIKINSVDGIFPQRTAINAESDITVEYVYLFKRSKKTRSLHSSNNLYYPIFVITPQEFFKNMSIDKRMYNQNDEIVNLSRVMVNQIFSGINEDHIEKEFNLKAILAYVDVASAATTRISSLYVNTKGVCYAVTIPTTSSSRKDVIIPIKYSSVDNIPNKYFLEEKKNVIHEPISSFSANTPEAIKEFIISYNTFVVENSEPKGIHTREDTHVRLHPLNKKEANISPKFPLIKIDSVLISIIGKTKDRIIGFVSNSLRYYISANMTLKEFYKYMNSGYNTFSKSIESEKDLGVYYVHYDHTVMNKMIYEYQNSENKDKMHIDPNMHDISKIIYEKHMYYLYTSELMAYLDSERNTVMRKKIMTIISSEDLRGKSEHVYQSLQALLLPNHPEDMERIDEILSRYYTSHYDRKTLIHEIEHMTYQFDRITLSQLRSSSEHFYGFNKEQQSYKIQEIRKIIEDVSNNFIIKKTPMFKKDDSLYMSECKSNLGKNVPYCDKGKLLIPGKRLDEFIQIFSDEVVNPLRRDYILSAVYISEIIDVYKFPKVPGEELYVKFG